MFLDSTGTISIALPPGWAFDARLERLDDERIVYR